MPRDISKDCTCVRLRDVPYGTYFKLTPTDTAPVWVRGEYVRGEKRYECWRYDDICAFTNFSGDRCVYIGFTF